jgi:hypothetical protein
MDELKRQLEIFNSDIQDTTEEIRKQLAHVPTMIENLQIGENAKKALKYSVNVILAEHHKRLYDLERGEITARSPEMYNVYGQFMAAVSKSFRAITADDLTYWSENDSQEYLEHNQALISRNGLVERIFLLKKTLTDPTIDPSDVEVTLSKLVDAVVRQIRMGVRVSIAYYDRCAFLGDKNNIRDLDFGLFDDFAVSFFRLEEGRSYKISTSRHACSYRRDMYENVSKRCEEVPSKTGVNRRVFETEAEFLGWVEHLRKRTSTHV